MGISEENEQLYFYQAMDRLERTLRKADNLDQMMRDALEIARSVTKCDRAWLLCPCDPEAAHVEISVASTGTGFRGAPLPEPGKALTSELADGFLMMLDLKEPLVCFPGDGISGPRAARSLVSDASLTDVLYPKTGKPWIFGVCRSASSTGWDATDIELFRETGERIESGLHRHLSYRRLMEREKRYRTIVETTPNFISISRVSDGLFLEVNDYFRRVVGYTKQEAIGKTAFDLNLFPNPADRNTLIQQLLSDGVVHNLPLKYRRKDGTIIDTEVSAKPVEYKGEACLIAIVTDITQRKKAEAALQQSEARYRSMWENTGTAAVILEEDATISMANAEFEHLCALPRTEIEGKRKWTEFVLPEELGRMKQYHTDRRKQTGSAPRRYEFGFVDNNGRVKHVVNTVAVIPGTQKSIASLIDITERRKTEKGLQESEELYTTLIAAIPDIVVRTDENGNILFVNDIALQTSGYAKEEIEGQHMLSFVAPEDHERLAENTRLMLEGRLGPREYHLLMKDGSKRLFEVNGDVLRDKAGAPYGIVSVCRDITQRKKDEIALRESEERYRAVLEASPDPIVAYDIQGRVTYVNPAFTNVFGWSLADLTDKKIDYVPESQWPATSTMINKVKRGESFAGFETQRLSKAGKLVEISMSAAIQRDNRGVPVGSVITLRDITDRKRLEKQLVQVQKMEAIGTLAGGIAHDFNNILSAIIGFTEICAGSVEKGSHLSQNLQKVLNAGDRAKNLVQQILAFSRQGELEPKPVQVKLIAEEALTLLRATIPTTIDIKQHLISNSAVMADPTQIHQIIMNLCTNAENAMQKNGGRLEVSLCDVDVGETPVEPYGRLEPGPYVRLTVGDTGQGMTADIVERIFDPFFTTKEKGKGTGMGLSVVHGIVESYGGKVVVDSKPGKGSIFDIFIPAIEAEMSAQHVSDEKVPYGSERILFVDDEELQVDLGQQILTRFGYSVTSNTSSVEALDLFRKRPGDFDLVITDMTMPQLTGEKLAKEIMRIRSDIPIILCTGYSELMTENQAKRIGIKAFIMKPIVLNEMAHTIRRVLDSAGS